MKNVPKATKKGKAVTKQMAGSQPELSAKVGGVSNVSYNTSSKKSGPRGSM
jgi:hypothetical protein